jgi:hypothetical protein
MRARSSLDWDDPWTSVTVDGEDEDTVIQSILTNAQASFELAAADEDGGLLLGVYDD